jgi:hypothetical protein
MIENLIKKGRQLLSSQQTSILSAATLIMLMIITSRVLGLVRQRVLANYFSVDELSLFFAAFRLLLFRFLQGLPRKMRILLGAWQQVS